MLKSLDFFSPNTSFFIQGNKGFKTNIGGMATIITVILISLLIFAFGNDFFKRTNPLIIRGSEVKEDFPIYNMTNKMFSTAVRLMDSFGNKLESEYFKIQAIYSLFEVINKEIKVSQKKIPLVPCTKEMFFSEEIFEENLLSSYYCPVFDNLLIGGSLEGNKFGQFYVVAYVCAKDKVHFYDPSVNNEICSTEIPIEEITYEFLRYDPYIDYFYQSVLITPDNYTNGLKLNLERDYFGIGTKLGKAKI